MVEDMGYTNAELGYYAGGLAAAFCGAQFCSSILWGVISDKYGRKSAIGLGRILLLISDSLIFHENMYVEYRSNL